MAFISRISFTLVATKFSERKKEEMQQKRKTAKENVTKVPLSEE